MSGRKKGIRIGNYRITPLGIGVFSGLLVIIATLIALVIFKPFGGTPDTERVGGTPAVTASPRPTAAAATADATVPPTQKPTVAPTPTPVPLRSARIRTIGEIAMETNLLKSAINSENGTFDFSPMFSEIAALMADADYTIADVEGTLGDTMGISGSGDKMYTPSALLGTLKECGVDMLMLANDHALDGTFAEQQATVANVSAAGLDYVGAAASAEERSSAVVKNINGIKVGFIAYCESMNGNEKKADKDALNYGVNLVAHSNALEDIQRAQDAGADVIVAVLNWGKMFSRTPSETQQQIAKLLASAGVDVIIGYNPHTVQPALWIEAEAIDGSGTVNRALCICATGNFLSDQRDQYFDSGVMFDFTIEEQTDGTFEIVSPSYIPTYVMRYENNEKGVYEYRTLAAGLWTDEDSASLLDGMTYADLQRMGAIWSEMQTVIDSSVASIARE